MTSIDVIEMPTGMKCCVVGSKIAIRNDSRHVHTVDFSQLFELLNKPSATRITHWCCDYMHGKQSKTAMVYLTRLKCTLSQGVQESGLSRLPKTQDGWQRLIKVLYGSHLINPGLEAALETRVKVWNSIIAPFLEWVTSQGGIPIGCLIPKMKRVGELNPSSSFKLKLIGSSSPLPINGSLDKLIIPVSLSRSDANYLDELYFDLHARRNLLEENLIGYWRVVVEHIEVGKRMIDSVCFAELQHSLSEGLYKTVKVENGTQSRRVHKASIRYYFANWLSCVSNIEPQTFTFSKPCEVSGYIPKEYPRHQHLDNLGLSTNGYDLKVSHRINLMLGNFSSYDVMVIMVLLTMRNPRFTFHSLLYADILDKDGYTYLSEKDSGWEYSIFKQRAKSKITDSIDELSLEILNTVISVGAKSRSTLNTRKLFTISKKYGGFGLPGEGVILRKLSSKSASDKYNLLSVIPALKEQGFTPGSLSFRKLRDTEAVLEWFRTGSIKAVTRKLGNSEKVVLESYLPGTLLAIWNTRQIRRFQNLLLTAATIGEDYSLEVTDFNSLSELNSFIADMLHLHSGSKNPLILALEDDTDSYDRSGSLAIPISIKVLTTIYLYEHAANHSGVSAEQLRRKSAGINICPLTIVKLSLLLKHNLPNHKTKVFKDTHMAALTEVGYIKEDISWSKLFISAEATT